MRVEEKVLSNYQKQKSNDRTIGCHLVSCADFGKKCAKLVIGSSGKLDKNTVRKFVFSCTDYKLIPYNETINYFQDKKSDFHYASVIAYKPSIQYKEAEKASGMVQINSNSFLDEELGNVWEKKEHNGKQYFVRSNDDNVDEILKEAYLNSSAMIRATNNIEEFTYKPSPGDYVEFFTFGNDTPGKSVGYVKSSSEESVEVKVNKKSYNIPVHAITAKVPGDEVNSVEEVVEWLKDAYPTEENSEYRRKINEMKGE